MVYREIYKLLKLLTAMKFILYALYFPQVLAGSYKVEYLKDESFVEQEISVQELGSLTSKRFKISIPDGFEEYFLVVGNPQIDNVRASDHLGRSFFSGDDFKYDSGVLNTPGIVFPLSEFNTNSGNGYVIDLEITSRLYHIYDIRLLSLQDLLNYNATDKAEHFALYGALSILGIIGIILYITLKKDAGIYFSILVFSAIILHLGLFGSGRQFIWRNYPSFQEFSDYIGTHLSIFCLFKIIGILFFKDYSPRFTRNFKMISKFFLYSMLLTFLTYGTSYIDFWRVPFFITVIVGLVISFKYVLTKDRSQSIPVAAMMLILMFPMISRITTFLNLGQALDISLAWSFGSFISFSYLCFRIGNNQIEVQRVYKSDIMSNMIGKEVIDRIKKGKTKLIDGMIPVDMSVIQIDIVSYQKISNAVSNKEDLLESLRIIHSEINRIVKKHGGFVNKTAGDSSVCVFGCQMDGTIIENHEESAFFCSQEILRASLELSHQKKTLPFLLRIGINTDRSYIGNIGEQERADYTIIGSAVDLAARYESAGNRCRILIGENTHKSLIANNALNLRMNHILTKHKGTKNGIVGYEAESVDIDLEDEVRNMLNSFLNIKVKDQRWDSTSTVKILCNNIEVDIINFSISGLQIKSSYFWGPGIELRIESPNRRIIYGEVVWSIPNNNDFLHGIKYNSADREVLEEILQSYLIAEDQTA